MKRVDVNYYLEYINICNVLPLVKKTYINIILELDKKFTNLPEPKITCNRDYGKNENFMQLSWDNKSITIGPILDRIKIIYDMHNINDNEVQFTELNKKEFYNLLSKL